MLIVQYRSRSTEYPAPSGWNNTGLIESTHDFIPFVEHEWPVLKGVVKLSGRPIPDELAYTKWVMLDEDIGLELQFAAYDIEVWKES